MLFSALSLPAYSDKKGGVCFTVMRATKKSARRTPVFQPMYRYAPQGQRIWNERGRIATKFLYNIISSSYAACRYRCIGDRAIIGTMASTVFTHIRTNSVHAPAAIPQKYCKRVPSYWLFGNVRLTQKQTSHFLSLNIDTGFWILKSLDPLNWAKKTSAIVYEVKSVGYWDHQWPSLSSFMLKDY